MDVAVCKARQHGRHLIVEATHTSTWTQPMAADGLKDGLVEVEVVVEGVVEWWWLWLDMGRLNLGLGEVEIWMISLAVWAERVAFTSSCVRLFTFKYLCSSGLKLCFKPWIPIYPRSYPYMLHKWRPYSHNDTHSEDFYLCIHRNAIKAKPKT